MVNEQFAKGVDFIWDGWLNSFKMAQKAQDDFEQKTIQAISYQNELLDSTISAIHSMEDESKKISKEWQEKAHHSLNEMNSNGQLDQMTKWLTSVQDITDHAQDLAWKPSHMMIDLFAQTQKQLETSFKTALEHQKNERHDTLRKIEEMTTQLKEAQKGLMVAK